MSEAESSKSTVSEDNEAPKRPTFEELKTKKAAAIEARIQFLQSEIASTTSKLEAVKKELKAPPRATIQTHITLLHRYNEIKDAGQMLLGLVVETRNRNAEYADERRGSGSGGGSGRGGAARMVRVRDVMEEVGLDDGD